MLVAQLGGQLQEPGRSEFRRGQEEVESVQYRPVLELSVHPKVAQTEDRVVPSRLGQWGWRQVVVEKGLASDQQDRLAWFAFGFSLCVATRSGIWHRVGTC
jgi:hypothetical protein